MKKRISSFIIVCIALTMLVMPVKAEENKYIQVDGSYLTDATTSKGSTKDGITTRGTHLMDGECSITKSGVGRIYVYSSTTANHDVDYISTVIYVDQYNEKTGIWEQIDCWQVQDVNTYYVSTNKMMMVDRGYYYRVHADHVAGMDADYPYEEATTATDGIFIN